MTCRINRRIKVARSTRRSSARVRQVRRMPSFIELCTHTQTLCLDPNHRGREERELSIDTYIPTIDDTAIDQEKMDEFDYSLWEALRGQSLLTWLQKYFQRSPGRLAYGHDQQAQCRSIDRRMNPPSSKAARGGRAHSDKEADRRVRHCVFQHASDLQCGEFHFQLADESMPAVKVRLGQLQRTNKASTSKVTGKDEQLLAALYQQKHSQWLVRIFQKLTGISVLDDEVDCMEGISASVAALAAVTIAEEQDDNEENDNINDDDDDDDESCDDY